MNPGLVHIEQYTADRVGKSQVIPVRYLRVRRFFEIISVTVLSPLAVIIILIAGLLIKAESKGSIFFIQIRPGRNGRPFRMFKLRTMYADVSQGQLTLQRDRRVTRIGALLRRLKIDEIPQLLNVLKGDMSFIGPRPVPFNFYEMYQRNIPGYNMRHTIRPGITGLAQVLQGYTNTLEGEQLKYKYDMHYIQNISFKMDFFIIRNTFRSLTTKQSAV